PLSRTFCSSSSASLPHLHSFPTRRSSDLGQDLADEFGVERAGRFVEEHHLRLHRQGARDRHPLLLTAGELIGVGAGLVRQPDLLDRKSTRLNSSHVSISYAVFCLKKKITE